MISFHKQWKQLAMTVTLAVGMTGAAATAGAHGYRHHGPAAQAAVRHLQQQLKDDGFYTGKVDGLYGPKTQAAIKQFQRKHNLAVTGRLDRETRDKMGITSRMEARRMRRSRTGEASRMGVGHTGQAGRMSPSRQSGEANRMTNENMSGTPSSATIQSAQRQLQQSGFYHGSIDGNMSPDTHSAIRQFQQQNNLPVNGNLDQNTLNKLGVNPGQQ
jgi:peptidoglycan hydrolase-like protein with peptidoglycan-binding domain